VAGSRVRKDGRQGTIDQDPEFKDFLESLTNPIVKPTLVEDDGTEKKVEKVTTTPLVQFLKDKKANKGKEAASSAKSSKHARQDSKDVKADKGPTQNKKVLNRSEKESQIEKKGGKESKVDKAVKEVVKVLNKQAASANTKAIEKPSPQPPAKETPQAPPVERKRERGSVRGAAAILQRDLGIVPPAGRRRQKQPSSEDNKATATSVPQTQTSPEPTKTPVAPKAPAQVPQSPKPTPAKPPNTAPPTGPATSRHGPKQSQPPPVAPSPKQTKAVPPPSPAPLPTGSQAFLKHANPSQGITEALLEEAFSVFGKLTKVEIDKRKGFGYLDFAEPEGLQKAIQASPVKVAQGQVQVLERKTGPTLAARNVRGGGNNAAVRGAHIAPVQPPPLSTPAAGRGVPQGPAMRLPHGPRGGRGRGGHRGGMGRGGHANTNVQSNASAGSPAPASPVASTTPAPPAPTSTPVPEATS
jgi:regulator of nonsense transcripts 3